MKITDQPESPATAPANPSLFLLFKMWLLFGAQSFGGGLALLALLRRAVVDEHRWMSDLEFTRNWVLCQIAPGINLLAFAILIGRRLGGALGIAACLVGMLLPSTIITILISAFYVRFQNVEFVHDAVRGIIPAAVGLGFYTTWNMMLPLIAAGRRDGRSGLMLCLAILGVAAAAIAVTRLSVALLLCGGGLIYAAFLERRAVVRKRSAGE